MNNKFLNFCSNNLKTKKTHYCKYTKQTQTKPYTCIHPNLSHSNDTLKLEPQVTDTRVISVFQKVIK